MKLIAKSDFKPSLPKRVNSYEERMKDERSRHTDRRLLNRAHQAWDNLRSFREQRRRYIQYTFGDQWSDIVRDNDGQYMTERQRMIRKDGQPPLQNNHISKIERALTGIYAKSAGLPVCFARQADADEKSEMMTRALQTNWERNSEKELLTASMTEMVVGGMPVLVEEWGTQQGQDDAYTYIVSPDYFFFEAKADDPRMWDVSLIGEIRDYTFNELVAAMSGQREGDTESGIRRAPGGKSMRAWLKEIYRHTLEADTLTDQMDHHRHESWNHPSDNRLCRTYRVWTLEYKNRYRCVDIMDEAQPLYKVEIDELGELITINKARVETFEQLYISQGMDPMRARQLAEQEAPVIEYEEITDLFWQCTVLSPDGDILDTFESPYEHGGHPYVFRPHQLINGRIYPFIGTIIDQQRYINRLVTLKDMYIRSMTKGLKFIPKTLLGGLSPEEFARQSVELNGWVFYEPDERNPNAVPQIVTQSAGQLGVEEMIALQVGWMNDISTVSGSLQGKAPTSGTSASRYMLETENSTTSIAALLQKFTAFELELATKKMKVIHQYYGEGRTVAARKVNGYMQYSMYDPVLVEDVDFDTSIKESAESPVSRMMINDVIMSMWQAGAINAEQMLEFSYLPGSQQILQNLRSIREQQAQQQEALQQQMAQAQQTPDAQGQQQIQNLQSELQLQQNSQQATQELQSIAAQSNPLTVQKVQQILQNRQPGV